MERTGTRAAGPGTLAPCLAGACLAVLALGAGCAGRSEERAPTATPSVAVTATPMRTPSATPAPLPTPSPTPTPGRARLAPEGFPLPAGLRVNYVIGKKGSREIAVAEGPTVAEYSERDQVSDDPVTANAGGWNCRTHVEYEGKPAVDWYVPEGTPVYATMDGEATLFVVTVANAFDFYGVPREPYYGDPDRARAPLDPFGGRPGGGKGVFVHIENERYIANYGHLSLAKTLEAVPEGAFLDGYGPAFDYAAAFGAPRRFDEFDAIARWEVRVGDVVGYTGDTGYSEAPHLHYEIASRSPAAWLCPTREDGFADGGWLSR